MRYTTIILPPEDGPFSGRCNTMPVEASSPDEAGLKRLREASEAWRNGVVLVTDGGFTNAYRLAQPVEPSVIKA